MHHILFILSSVTRCFGCCVTLFSTSIFNTNNVLFYCNFATTTPKQKPFNYIPFYKKIYEKCKDNKNKHLY